MQPASTSDLWWKNAVVYCLDIEKYFDADGDRCGDVRGLIDRLDHLTELGVSCLWLMPFYPTPNRDDGYDIADFLAVDPRLGDLGDLVELIRHARDRGLRVIVDFVGNHTSDEHPWFRGAHRDYYVWCDDPAREKGTSADNWTWHEAVGRYYLHRFAPFQPDLDIGNPAVRDELAKTIGFWLALGVSGFRMDAVPFLVEDVEASAVETGGGKRWLAALRDYATRRRGETMLMGEVNVDAADLESYFGDHGDALHLQLAFLINQRLWLALARGEAAPLEDLIRHLPVPPHDNGWGIFLRNHDELTLDKLSDAERDEVFAAFAPEQRMRIYGHGIRRRAASMLGGDGPRLRMAWSLMLSLPGTPVIFYGDELGMEEDLEIEGRMSVRTPFEWDRALAQRRDPDSLMNWLGRLIRTRRRTPELGWGASTLIENDPPELFAHRCDWQGSTVVAAHNLADAPVGAELDLGEDVCAVEDLLDLTERPIRHGRLRVELEPYGSRWLRLRR